MLSRFTTLLEDDTDTFFDSALIPRLQLVGYLVLPKSSRENFADGITTSGLTVGNSSTAGFIELLPTGTQSSYRLQNDSGTLNLSKDGSAFFSISSGGDLSLTPLQFTSTQGDTTELVPVLVDQNGKIYRGHSLFQTISQLTQRIQALEAAGSVQVEQRVSSVEQIVARLRQRYNDLNLSNSAI